MGATVYSNENEDPDQSQFKGISYLKHLKKHLEEKFTKSFGLQMSGRELIDIIEAFIITNKDRKIERPSRDCAIKVGNMLYQEGYLRRVSGDNMNSIMEDRRSMYRLGTSEEQRSIVMIFHSSKDLIDDNEKVSRKGSFSRILNSPLLRKRSTSRSRREESKISYGIVNDDELLNDSANLFEISLGRLLTLVDIPQIEEFVDMQSHVSDELHDTSTLSLITSILSKMGLWYEEEEGMDPVTESILRKHRRADLVYGYFKAVRLMCPRLRVEENTSLDQYDQIEEWCRQSLKAVVNRLESITRNGSSTIIPREFTKGLTAISILSHDKLVDALSYLCGMIPYKLRSELYLIINFLKECKSTNLFFKLCDPQICKGTCPYMEDENMIHAIDSVRSFIIPSNSMNPDNQRRILITLVDELNVIRDTVSKLLEESKGHSSPVPTRFCETDENESSTDHQLADLITLILKDERLSQPDKYKKIQLMQTQHPRAYALFIKKSAS